MTPPSHHKITTIQDLIDVVNDDNAEVLKHDLGEFIEWVAAAKNMPKLITLKPYFTWNDDGVKGIKAVHFEDKQGNKVTVDVPKEAEP